ncbi:hypothetical protein AB0G35_09605 [Streptomyces sp. NPDC021749]
MRASVRSPQKAPAALGAEIAEAPAAPLDVAVVEPVPSGELGTDRLPNT